MEFKVRELEAGEEKSLAQREEEILDQHKEQEEGVEQEQEQPESEEETLTDERVLKFLGNRYGRDINSFDDLMSEREEQEEMPEDVSAYLKYKKETGRGIEDYVRLNRDFGSMNEDSLLREYYKATEDGLDSDDIDVVMEEFLYDEDIDDESDIRKKKLAKKKVLSKAKKHFETQKEFFKQPLESSGSLTNEQEEELGAYRKYIESASTQKQENERRQTWFTEKTDELFNGEFKGFEFNLNDKNVTFKPGSADELKKLHSNPMNFVMKYLDDSGLLKDSEGYHRALAVAMNPEKFAKFFYEQGQSEATEDVMRKTKNVNMSERRTPEVTSKGGMKIKAVSTPSSRGLKIRSKKNS
tara:strand:+ start:10257 stop:11321 length:1065 start_codon:yes stop_codon:yes gene_type:complete